MRLEKQNFTHLHTHTEYSYLDTAVRLFDLIPYLKEKGFSSYAITDHANIDGCVRFYNECKGAGIKPIIGCELYVVKDISIKEKGEKRYHLTVLCKNQKGFESLCTLLTKANLEGMFYKPRVSLDDVLKTGEGLIVLSGCSSSPFYIYSDYVEKFKERFKDDFYLEVQPFATNWRGDRDGDWYYFDLLKRIREWREVYGIKTVMTNDVHYIREEDEIVQQVALAIRDNKKWKDPTRRRFNVKGLFVRTREQMVEEAKKQGIFTEEQINEFLDNTNEIADKVEFEMHKREPVLPVPDEFADKDEHQALVDLCIGKLKERNLDKDERYVSRLSMELEAIVPKFTRYFLIVYDLVSWARSHGIFVGPGRGSVAGSLVAYLLGVTLVDPLKYDLLFERFISPGRIDLPDVDMDFEDRRRKEIFEYLKSKYGEYNVAYISSFSLMKGRQVLRDIGRVFEIPVSRVSEMTSVIASRNVGNGHYSTSTVRDAFTVFDTGKKFVKDYPSYASYATKLEGLIRQTGIHAAGIVISLQDLRFSGNCVLKRDEEGNLAVNWDKRDLEFFGLVKYDILGLTTLSILKDAAAMVKKSKGVDVHYEKQVRNMDDKNVYEMLSAGDTFGVFQLGSFGLSTFCKKIGVEDFRSICDLSALHRPSGIGSGIITKYEERKKGRKKITYAHKVLEPVLKSTFGLPFYQEQVMFMLNRLAGMPWRTVDYIRKIISKSQGIEQIMKFKQEFVAGCKRNGTLGEKKAEEVFEELKYFGSYGFNKSHCVCYSIIAYWTAWMKYYYPLEYFCSYLVNSPGKEEICLRELARRNIPYYMPDINLSEETWAVKEGRLICGLKGIKNIGDVQARRIVEERNRNGRFSNLYDFRRRVRVGSRVLRILTLAGALNSIITDEEYARIVNGVEDKPNQEGIIFGEKEGFAEKSIALVDVRERRKYQREVVPFFAYDDVFGDHKELAEFISSCIPLVALKDLNSDRKKLREGFALGKVDEIKYGYRSGEANAVKGISNDLGSVYGNFRDGNDFAKIVFPRTFYKENAELVENLGGKSFVAEFYQPFAKNSVFVKRLWALDDISVGKIEGLGIDLMLPAEEKMVEDPRFIQLLSRKDCSDLGKEYGRYVPLEVGAYRIMVVGEAPGKEEDEQGKPFVGSAGKLLWNTLKKYGLDRDYFFISNYVKCRPPENKIKDMRKARICFENNLKVEIEIVKPTVILALGSIITKAFSGNKITEMAGKVRWNSYYNCFIVYCLHPASVLYHRENMEMFEAGIRNFARFLAGLNPVEVQTMKSDEGTEESEIEE